MSLFLNSIFTIRILFFTGSYSNEVYVTNPCESIINIRYFGSFQNSTENMCIVNDTLFSFSVDDNLKNKPIADTINVIEVIPLTEESEKEYEAISTAHQNSTQQNLSNSDLNVVNEDKDISMEGDEDEPEYEKNERFKFNVEANHSQHSDELKDDLRRKETQEDSFASDEDTDEEFMQQQPIHLPEGTNMVSPGQQLFQQSPKRAIKIWDSRIATSGLSNIPFMTGSSCHGCSTLFKINSSAYR